MTCQPTFSFKNTAPNKMAKTSDRRSNGTTRDASPNFKARYSSELLWLREFRFDAPPGGRRYLGWSCLLQRKPSCGGLKNVRKMPFQR